MNHYETCGACHTAPCSCPLGPWSQADAAAIRREVRENAPAPSAAPLPPLPEYVEEALRDAEHCIAAFARRLGHAEADVHALGSVRAAIRRYAEGDPRPAGCVCPVERVRREVRACPVHGEKKP